MKTIRLTVVLDDTANPMAERIVHGAIRGITPTLRRQADSVEYEVYDVGPQVGETKESEGQR